MCIINRDFKGIWIPKDIWLSEDLTLQEKLFLVEIDSLDNEEGCYATNDYFANFFGISKTRVSLVIKSLVDKGYIESTLVYKEGTKEILKRVLKVCYRGYLTKVKEGIQGNLNTPIQQKLKDNNTLINNTTNNTINKNKKKKEPTEIDTLIDKYTEFEELRKTLRDFVIMRKSIKKPLTTRAMELIIKDLDKKGTNDYHKIQLLEQSIMNSWQGIFDLKQDFKGKQQKESNNVFLNMTNEESPF